MRTEDGHIIHECISGDSASFGLLVDKYKASIFALAYSRLNNFQDAEDVTQEVFLKSYKSLRTLRHWDNFVVWLRSVTINLCKNKIREQSRRRDKFSLKDQNVEIIEKASLDSYREEQSSSWRNEALNSLDEALNSLPEQYRQILTLHYLGGMKGEEISKLLSISHDTVRQRLSRARAMLKEEVLAMISANYEHQRLSASFTFRIIEMVKKIKIHPTSGIKGLPWGLSLGAGFICAVLLLGQHIQINLPDISMGLPLPSEMKVLKVGEIPVDTVKVSTISSIGIKGDGKSIAPDLKGQENAFFMAPQAEGNTIVKKADIPSGGWLINTAVVNGKIYTIGGCLCVFEEYDPKTDAWGTKDWPIKDQFFPSTCTVNNVIYIIGGDATGNGGGPVPTVQVYNPVTDEFVKKADMPNARYYICVSAVNGKIYTIGGRDVANVNDPGGNVFSSVEEYDPVTDTWTKKADMLIGRWYFSTCAVNGKIYTFGGIGQNNACLSSMEEYDPITDTWTKKADMPTPRYGMATSAVNGKIYAFGGLNFNTNFSSVDEYDPKEDKWTKKTDMAFARWLLSTAVVDGKVYAIGGQSAAVNLVTTVEEYTPEGWPFAISPQGKLPSKWGMLKAK